ncbi:hypothetical protein BBD32_12505 [Elizabethkingia anophelis]|uniref:Metallo-beta-lactamase domain-containing protein n=1 Tax=Elizabethkingia anophelis TaxID=1117645 RepID=A0AAU8VGJ4_9FLAO|nr:hypothetical protein BBD32_12505 [Elizabethkingia anophelis]OPB60870.1 hypothetical protein BAY11_17760 [Elizabethkingia anophelis]
MPPLGIQVITSSSEGFQVNATLITGEKDAILIDAQFTMADAQVVVDNIHKSGKNLTTIYISHSHPDHYFGLEVIKKAFPNAKIIALPSTVADINLTWQEKLNTWKPVYGDKITSAPIIPDVFSGSSLMLDGQKILIFGNVQGDEKDNSYVWIPSLKAVICGDIVYKDSHPWTLETTSDERLEWIKTIDKIAALKPITVVSGHKKLSATNDISALDFTKRYLLHFNKSLPLATNSQDFQSKIKSEFPDLDLEVVLQLAADHYFPN